MVSTSTLPYFRVPVHFRAIDFCRDLWSGPTPELDERNIHFGELLCKAGKETRLFNHSNYPEVLASPVSPQAVFG